MMILGLMALSFFSCKSDDNRDDAAASVIGTWKPYKFEVLSGKTREIFEKETKLSTDCEKKGSINFNADGSYFSVQYIDYQGDCILDDEEEKAKYVYNKEKKELTVDWGDNEISTGKVRELTQIDFVLEGDYNYDVDGDGIEDIYVSYYKRQ